MRKLYDEAFAVLVENEARSREAFSAGVRGARTVRLPGANHYVFLSNESDVLREIQAFLVSLK